MLDTSVAKRNRRGRSDIDTIKAAMHGALTIDRPMTVRQIFYRLVSEGVIAKTEAEYKTTVVRLLGEMRRAKEIPFNWIADNTRWMRKPRTFHSLETMLRETSRTYRRQVWDNQDAAVHQLQTFLEQPYPVAFLFEGPTGVGKTSAARALASDLGLSLDSVDYFEIDSGRQDGDAVDRIIDLFRFAPMFGGFRVVVVNEADLMTPKAAHLWLSGLESIPQRTVIIFTTNFPERFPDRFLDRCERIRFESDGRALRPDAQNLIDSIWSKETGMDDAPDLDDIPDVVDRSGLISFRRVVSALAPMLRAKRAKMPAGRPTVSIGTPEPIETTPTADERPTSIPDASATVALAEPVRRPRKRAERPAADIRPDDSATLSSESGLLQRRIDDATSELERIEELSVANAERITHAREQVRRAGDHATPEWRAELKAAESEDARLVKLWLATTADRGRAERAAKRLDPQPARTARKRSPVTSERPPDPSIPFARGVSAKRLADLLTELATIEDQFCDAAERETAIQSALSMAPKAERPGIQADLDRASDARFKLQSRMAGMEYRIKRLRAEIDGGK